MNDWFSSKLNSKSAIFEGHQLIQLLTKKTKEGPQDYVLYFSNMELMECKSAICRLFNVSVRELLIYRNANNYTGNEI